MCALRKRYECVVIGAGPAGLAALANLLDANVHPLLWVDPCFNAGRLSRYQSVPSNTKVKLFMDFALASPTLARVVESSSPDPLHELRKMDPSSTCVLKHAVEMVSRLSAGVKDLFSDRVSCFQGWAHHVARQDSEPTWWTVELGESEHSKDVVTTVASSSVIFATGSHPTPAHPSWAPHDIYSVPGKVQQLSLETALDPSELSNSVSDSDVVAVVGSSHSAVLCLKNLAELSTRPKKILHYYRNEFLYAVEMDGWILYDNTGLKGNAAIWAREVLEPGGVPFIERQNLQDGVTTEAEVYKKSMGEVTKIIYAIGFHRNKLPQLLVRGVDTGSVNYLAKTGKLTAGGEIIAGLWGYGIGFPEEVVDPHGNKEHAVGLWKFMKYMKRSIPQEVVPELAKN